MIEIFNIDCIIGMQKYPDKYFDLAVVDTPYGRNYLKKGIFEIGFGERWDNRTTPPTPIKTPRTKFKFKDWDRNPPNREYFKELKRVSRKQIIWGENFLYHLIPEISSGRIVWDKCHYGNPHFCEIAWTNLFQGVVIFRYMWNGMFQGKSIDKGWIHQGNKKLNEKRVHPTQKPLKLYEWILINYAKRGNKILDTHLGSGNIAIACQKLELDLIGFEIDKEYYQMALNNLNNFQEENEHLRFPYIYRG